MPDQLTKAETAEVYAAVHTAWCELMDAGMGAEDEGREALSAAYYAAAERLCPPNQHIPLS